MTYNKDLIDSSEIISRFAYESGYYRRDGTARTKAFEPDRDNEVSVFRIDDLSDAELWALGDEAGSTRAKAAQASIWLSAQAVSVVALRLDIAEPPPRHAAIRGWPEDHLRMQAQQALASAAKVKLRT